MSTVERTKWDESTRGESQRPFRLWDARKKVDVRWRYYASERSAHTGALIELWWYGHLGDSYEVYDIRTGRLLGTYTKRTAGVGFLGPASLQSRLTKES